MTRGRAVDPLVEETGPDLTIVQLAPARCADEGRTTRHSGYAVSVRVRKRIEEVFGWTKAAAGFRKTHHRGLARVSWMFTLTATAYNLVRLPKLVGAVA